MHYTQAPQLTGRFKYSQDCGITTQVYSVNGISEALSSFEISRTINGYKKVE